MDSNLSQETNRKKEVISSEDCDTTALCTKTEWHTKDPDHSRGSSLQDMFLMFGEQMAKVFQACETAEED